MTSGADVPVSDSVDAPYETDVLVCGGGMAGCGAAIAAARLGVKTMLVEQSEILGGLGSGGGVGNFSAAEGGHEGLGRVYADVLAGLNAYGAIGEEHGWRVRLDQRFRCENRAFDHQVLPLVLLELAESSGVRCLFSTTICGAEMGNGALRSVTVHNRSLLRNIRAQVFVDATGDGILARHAGAHELPDDPRFPGVVQPGYMIYLRKTENVCPQPVPGSLCFDGDTAPEYSIWDEPGGRVGLKMRLFRRLSFDTGTGEGYNEALLAMRRRIPEVVRHYQQHHDPHMAFDFACPMLGLREGRRIEGDYVLTIDDVRSECRFGDAVVYGTFTIDANSTREMLPPYQIPYRSLLVKGVKNGLVVGRCFSADRLVLSSARVMPTACMTGNAAGIAAAIAVQHAIPIRDIRACDIRETLIREDTSPGLIRARLGMP